MSIIVSTFRTIFLPWTIRSKSMDRFVQADPQDLAASQWSETQVSELSIVNVTGALIAAIVASVFSWPTIISSPWTAKACFYTTLYLSLFAVTCGFQQNITLVRYGKDAEGVAMLQKLLRSTNGKSAGRLHLFVWQIPIMLVNFSIMSFLMGLSILIWDQTTTSVKTDLAIAIITTIFGGAAFGCYLLGAATVYRQKSD